MKGGRVPGLGWIAGGIACGLLACAQGGGAPEARQEVGGGGHPLLWLAEAPESDAAFFLMGSVHLGDKRMLDFGDVVREAFDASDELVVEIDLSSVKPGEMQDLLARFAVLPTPLTLEDVLSDDTWQELTSYLDSRGVSREPLVRMKPWFIALTIVQVEMMRAGYQPDLGVDHLFIEAAQDTKPIVALESMTSQLEVFDAASADVQEILLSDTLARVDELGESTDDLIEAWEQGDEERLEQLVFQEMNDNPELDDFYERLFFERNRTMTAGLLALAEDGRTRFVVLGAGHMVGDEGIPALLGRRGYHVQKLDR